MRIIYTYAKCNLITEIGLNDTAQGIERSFRELLKHTRYRSLTVKDVCERAQISRKTFYAYFDGKDDIIDKIFRRDVVDPVRSLARMLSNEEVRYLGSALHERIFIAVREDGDYYRDLVLPQYNVDYPLYHVASRALAELYSLTLARIGLPTDTLESSYITYFFGSGMANLIEKWVHDGYNLEPDQLAKVYTAMVLPYWNAISKC